nr:EOG090X05XL [Moina brachiata]
MATLFDDNGSDDEGQLTINQGYADKYDKWREKEEYQKLKDKYGEETALKLAVGGNDDEGSSSTSEEEDEDGDSTNVFKAWDSDVEKRFLQTLASLKTKDPSIYNSESQFFDKNKELVKTQKKAKKDDPFTLRDYERKLVLEKGGRYSDDEEEAAPVTYNEEQEKLKKGFKKFLQDSDAEEDDLLKVRSKDETAKQKEDEEYREWLKGTKKDIKNEEIKTKLEPLKKYWSDPKLDENEKFLKDYILNKRYKCSEDQDYIPSYEEIVQESDGELSEDEQMLEHQAEFEHKYNFRFEEPDPEFIKRYPRTIADSLRRPDTSRKQKRDEVKERKLREKEEKKEELKLLKKFKLKEIQEKLEQLKSITGNPTLPFQDNEFEEDFDPDAHDRKMKEIFNDDYYEVGEADQKPEFPFDPEIDDENWDAYTGQNAGPSTSQGYQDEGEDGEYYDGPNCEDPDFIMDCDYEESVKKKQQKEMVEMTKRNRGRKKSVFAKKLEEKKPSFDPTQYPNYEEYLEEYYKLDYEDIIGDQPVRFKYRTVVPNDFGLDVEEILTARDKELNQWCSVKRMSQYRTEHEEVQDVHVFKGRKQSVNLKKKYLPSLFAENPEELLIEDQENDRKKRRRHQGKEEDPDHQADGVADSSQINEEEPPQDNADGTLDEASASKKKKKIKKQSELPTSSAETNEPTVGTDINDPARDSSVQKAQKKKKRLSKVEPELESNVNEEEPAKKKPKMSMDAPSSTSNQAYQQATGENQAKKKKKKKKKKKAGTQSQPQTPAGPSAGSKKLKKPATNKKPAPSSNPVVNMPDDRLKAYGIKNPKRFKCAVIFGKGHKS